MGRKLMESGAEIYRVEESVSRLLSAYGVQAQVFAIPNCLIVSVTALEGQPITQMYRIPAHGTDIELLERCNDLCRQLCREVPPLEEALARVEKLEAHRRQFPAAVVLLLGYMMASCFFSLFFGGSARDGVCAAFAGLAGGLCLLGFAVRHWDPMSFSERSSVPARRRSRRCCWCREGSASACGLPPSVR